MGLTRKPIFIILLLFSVAVFSQERFSGKIIADSIAFTQVNIVNFTQELGTTNNSYGEFAIDAEVGDEVIFSSVQYEPYQITVTQAMLHQKNNIILFPLVNELEEVKISDIDLSGDLNKDANSIETNPFFDPKKHGLPVNTKPKPTTAQRRIYTATTSGGGIIPLDPIINAISGRLAMVYRQRDYEIEKNLMVKAYNSRPLDFFTIDLGIPEDLVEDFLYYCVTFKPFKELIVQQENTFKLSGFYKEKAKAYKELRSLEE